MASMACATTSPPIVGVLGFLQVRRPGVVVDVIGHRLDIVV
jgi:hypothetical protein